MDRREYMELLAAGGALGVAGCSSANQETTEEPPADDVPTTAEQTTTETETTVEPTAETTTETTTQEPTETTQEPTTQQPTTQEQTTESPTQTTEKPTQTTETTTQEQTTTTEEPTTTTEEPTTTTEEPTETPAETTEEPTETTTEEGQATFELVAFDAPEEVDMGTAFTYSFTVENTGGATGEFSTEVSTKVDDWVDYPTDPFVWSATLAPSEQATFESQEIKGWWDVQYTIRLETPGEEKHVRFTRPILAFGEYFELWDGKRISIDVDVGDQNSYSVPVYDYDAIELSRKDPSNTFIHAWISMEDISAEIWQFVLGSSGEWYSSNYGRHPGFYPYQPNSDGIREGWLTFEASSSFEPEDVTVSWEDEDAIGMIGAYWTNNPAGVP